ncbi:unnamed protein product [Fraxinus pennsylvanica]|uniref:Uncharacterized protein n=1 Tax=Fraxinus pennsylvanica TaxID=56036 RepID=A0AAD1Z9G7_9LAMI|nr:unnamed protein product [Fraxinus pennsylvanica]
MFFQTDYNRLRPSSYCGADVFFLHFSLISKASYENIAKKLRHYASGVALILVGTKLDKISLFLRYIFISFKTLLVSSWSFIQFKERRWVVKVLGLIKPFCRLCRKGEELKKLIGSAVYIECSSKTQQNVKAVFDAAIKIVLQPPKQVKIKDDQSSPRRSERLLNSLH